MLVRGRFRRDVPQCQGSSHPAKTGNEKCLLIRNPGDPLTTPKPRRMARVLQCSAGEDVRKAFTILRCILHPRNAPRLHAAPRNGYTLHVSLRYHYLLTRRIHPSQRPRTKSGSKQAASAIPCDRWLGAIVQIPGSACSWHCICSLLGQQICRWPDPKSPHTWDGNLGADRSRDSDPG